MKYDVFRDYYALLGVRPDASVNEIKRAIKAEMLKHHPDRNGDKATDRARDIVEARAVLLVHADRKEYDAQREAVVAEIVRLIAASAAPSTRGARWNAWKKRTVRRAHAREPLRRGARFG